MRIFRGLSLVAALVLLVVPTAPASFTAGGCDFDNNGPLNKCNGLEGNTCHIGVKTCQEGSELSLCKTGTPRDNSGTLKCFTEDSDNCSGHQYHSVTNATGCGEN